MHSFYSSLYSPHSIDFSLANNFLDKIKLPSVTPSQLQILNAPISLSEISNAINHIALGKASGPDNLTGEFYKVLHKTFKPVLLDICSTITFGMVGNTLW